MNRAWIAALVVPLAACGGGDGEADREAAAVSIAEDVESQVDSVTKIVEITEDNDPNNLIGRPNGYETAAVIYDSRVHCDDLGVECGAVVEQWPDDAAAEQRSAYIQGILEGTPAFGTEYHYLDGAVLLRVWGDLNPTDAEEYEDAFS